GAPARRISGRCVEPPRRPARTPIRRADLLRLAPRETRVRAEYPFGQVTPENEPRGAGVRPDLWLALASVGGSFLVYWPFLRDFSTVYRFWDGPNFLAVAR